MKSTTVKLNKVPGLLSMFPIVKTIQPEEFNTWMQKYIDPNESIVGTINDIVICTSKGIAYALPKGYKFINNTIIQDNTIEYKNMYANDDNTVMRISDNKFIPYESEISITPLLDRLNYDIIPKEVTTTLNGSPIKLNLNLTAYLKSDSYLRSIDDNDYSILLKLLHNYGVFLDSGYDVCPNLLGLNGSYYINNEDANYQDILNLFNKYYTLKRSNSLVRSIDTLLPNNMVQTTTSSIRPAAFPSVNHCTCGHNHQPQNNNIINGASVVNNINAMENRNPRPINRLIPLIETSIREAGFNCAIEMRPTGLYNVNILFNNTVDLSRSFIADIDGIVLDPRPKYFPFMRPNFPVSDDCMINYADIGNLLVNDKGDYIADNDIKNFLNNNVVNGATRCYNTEDQELLKMINTLSITSKRIDSNAKLNMLKSILRAFKKNNQALANEIRKYQKNPMFVLKQLESNNKFTIYSEGSPSEKALTLEFDVDNAKIDFKFS